MWTDVKIPQFTRFGPYEGIKQPVKDIKQDEVSGYGWLVSIDSFQQMLLSVVNMMCLIFKMPNDIKLPCFMCVQ